MYIEDTIRCSLRKQPSFFAPGPSGVSRDATRAGSEEGRLFSQARSDGTIITNKIDWPKEIERSRNNRIIIIIFKDHKEQRVKMRKDS